MLNMFHFLRCQIRTTIAENGHPQLYKEKYPGYWLLQAREYLEDRDYQLLMSQLSLDPCDVDYYKLLFRASVRRALEVI